MIWNRHSRQLFVALAVVGLMIAISMFYQEVTSDPMDNLEMTAEQMKILRAFNPALEKAEEENNHAQEKEKERRETDNTIKERKEVVSASKLRSDKLLKQMDKVCKNFNISLPLTGFMLAHMHFDHQRKVVYCFTPKVACTSWKRIWMKLTGLVAQDKDISTIPRYTIHSSIPNLTSQRMMLPEILATYKKFMFVRHPFDRVLSAYKDKLEHTDTQSSYNFHKEIGGRIQKKYRKQPSNYTGDDVTFSEFIKFISEPGHGTFEQRNEHWLSVHDLCNPCGVKYDFVGKYETLKEDSEYVLNWIGATDLVKEFPASDRPFHARHFDEKYFSQLDHTTRTAFFQKFLLDFATFNYTYA